MTIWGYLFVVLFVGVLGYNIYKLVGQIKTYKNIKSKNTNSSKKED